MKTALIAFLLILSPAFAKDGSQDSEKVAAHVQQLLKSYEVRLDYPLQKINYDDKAQQWVLLFGDLKPDAAFTVIIKDHKSEEFRLQWAGVSWFEQFPKKKR